MKKSILMACFLLVMNITVNAQKQYYRGTSDGRPISATITWNSDDTVDGSYFFVSNSSRVFRLSGTNYIEGEIEITTYLNGKRQGAGTLYKSIRKNQIVWSGDIYNPDGSTSYITLTRAR